MTQETRRWLDDIEPREERFSYKGVNYLLTEPSASAIRVWRDALLQDSQIGPDGRPVGIKVRPETDSLLVSRCLFKISGGVEETGEVTRTGGGGSLTPVAVEEVEAFPHRLQSRLLKLIREMGEMNPLPDDVPSCDEAIKECEDRLVELRKQRQLLTGTYQDLLKNGATATTGSSA